MNEAFEEVDGSFECTGTLVVYETGDSLHHALSRARHSSPLEVKLEHLINYVPIPISAYSPLFPPDFTHAPDLPPQNCHIKTPRLIISYDRNPSGILANLISAPVGGWERVWKVAVALTSGAMRKSTPLCLGMTRRIGGDSGRVGRQFQAVPVCRIAHIHGQGHKKKREL